MKRKNWVFFAVGILFVAVSAWQVAAAQRGLQVITLPGNNPPVTVISPAGVPPASRPTVLIAHGFAGSTVLMRGFALTLAHAGYTTVSWDFKGNGANPQPFLSTMEVSSLLQDAETAFARASSAGLVDTRRVAILGHSMGSGVALAYGVAHPDTYATIAISPFSQSVSPSLPHNLLVMVGNLQPGLVPPAEQLVNKAGGEGGSLADGTARQLTIIPNTEHIAILFSPLAERTARDWLDGTFGVQPGAVDFVDHRILWYLLGIAGFIILSITGLNGLLPLRDVPAPHRPLWRRLLALLVGGLGATLILWLVSLAGIDLTRLLGLLVGGYIIIWFGLAGVIALLVSRAPLSRPSRADLVKGLIAFLALWLGVGLLGNFVWLPWLLIPLRLRLWIPASILIFPWSLAIGQAAKTSRLGGQVGWWLAQVVVMIGALYLAFTLTPGLFFIFLILPVIPIMLALHSLAVSPRQGPWPYSLAGAMFIAWLLLAVFPLQ